MMAVNLSRLMMINKMFAFHIRIVLMGLTNKVDLKVCNKIKIL